MSILSKWFKKLVWKTSMASAYTGGISYFSFIAIVFWSRVFWGNFTYFWGYMKKRTFLIFVAYIWLKMLVKLTTEPFISVRQITRRTILLPVIFSPIIGLVVLFTFGRFSSLLINIYGFERSLISLFLSTILISFVLWQLLLLYLLFSFLFLLKD